MFEPAYLKALKEGTLADKVIRARKMLLDCHVCPRECAVNRLQGETGFCGIGAQAVVSSAHPHYGEEEPLVGNGGSGTIFFTSCNLKCTFCQNFEISHLMEGAAVDTRTLGSMMLSLQGRGCHNINFVTPSHVVPQVIEAVQWGAEQGLSVPLVYNTGSYDALETLALLDGIIDIYMPDLKFMDSAVTERVMNARDYPEIAKKAIREMHRQVGDLQVNRDGIATRGVLVRHLVMPRDLAGTKEAMRFLAREISTDTYVNIMNQYRPCGKAFQHEDLNTRVTQKEFIAALRAAEEEGITRLDQRTGFRLRFL
jgi:putative pyruvate formate lyase activating enzyme